MRANSFSDNKQISGRQVFRLFTFCCGGLGSLILPARLAEWTGGWGWISILAGGGLGAAALFVLMLVRRGLRHDGMTWLKKDIPSWGRVLIAGILFAHSLIGAVFCLDIFTEVMKQNLVKSESYLLIMAIVLALAAYAVSGGLESWARIYEVLFWVVFIPLLGMLIIGGTNMDPLYLIPDERPEWRGLLRGSFDVFIYLMIFFWALFFPEAAGSGKRKKSLTKELVLSLVFSVLLFVVIYEVVLGNFGAKALAALPFPAITLMSTVQIGGSFVKRLDAPMLGVWFFTLFALLTMEMFFGVKMLRAIPGKAKDEEKKIYLILTTAIIAALTFAVHRFSAAGQLCQNYLSSVGVWILVGVAAVMAVTGMGRKRGK